MQLTPLSAPKQPLAQRSAAKSAVSFSDLPHNLYLRMLCTMVACISLVLLLSTALNISRSQARLSDDLLARGQNQADILTNAASVYVVRKDAIQLAQIVEAATQHNHVQYIIFFDRDDTPLATGIAPNARDDVQTQFSEQRARLQATGEQVVEWGPAYLDIVAPVTWQSVQVGAVGVRLDTRELDAARAALLSQSALTALLLTALLSLSLGLLLRQLVIVPLRRFSAATDEVSRGIWTAPLGQDRRDELGLVARSFARMVTALQSRESQLQEQITMVQRLNAELDQKVAERTVELQRLVSEQEQLLRQIHEMSIPVVPVQEGVIVVPLIGSLDQGRAAQLMQNVLDGVQSQRAKLAVIDITGVPVVDTQVANALLRVAQAAGLLGAEVFLVGVRPEVAQTIVQLGVQLGGLRAFATLQEALQETLRRELARSRGPRQPLAATAR